MTIEKSGISLKPSDYKRMDSLINERIKRLKLKSFSEYIEYLKSNTAKNEWEELINEMTVPETYFFRDVNQCNALKNYILPALIKSKKEKEIRIWSAGCSTGEEVYTIAIIIARSIPDFKLWNIKLIGTDINQKSIEKAKKGIYTKNSFRGVNEEIIEGYFNKTGQGWKIKELVRSQVQLGRFNLKLDDSCLFPYKYSGFDVIFCRNVFIYFEKKMIQNILKGFYNSLLPNGYLILGHSEASLSPKKLFRPIRTNNTFVYTRPGPEVQLKQKIPPESIRNSKIPSSAAGQTLKYQRKKPPAGNPQLPASYSQTETHLSIIYQKALSLYSLKKYSEAEAELDSFFTRDDTSVEILLLASLIRINLGDFKRAISYVYMAQQKNEFLPEAHFILGLIHENENDYQGAIKEYQSVLFLNNNFFLSYFRLGHLYRKIEKRENSVRSFKSALSVIESEDEEKIRLLSGGFSKKNLEDICRRGIQES